MVLPVGKRSLEQLTHYNCGKCKKWWSIGDSPTEREIWYCPWCGCKQRIPADNGATEGFPTPSSQ